MKVRYLGTLLLAILTFSGCDDNTGSLGMDMLPDSDGMSAHTTTFDVITQSLVADSVFAKTSIGYVGKFTDKEFGFYEASFLTELNCTDNFSLPEVYKYDPDTKTGSGILLKDSVVSVQLVIFYSRWFGDSLNACRMSLYELDKKLAKDHYTNIDPKDYYSNTSQYLLGRKAYTAFDTTVPDSIRYGKDERGNPIYYPNITFQLDNVKFGEDRILNVYRKNPEYFKNAATFIDKIFKGVYVKSDYGDGTILYIDRVDLQMTFPFHVINDTTGVARKKKDGNDSIVNKTTVAFASTKEVIQANQFLNSEMIKKKAEEKEHTYIKSPAGIFTEAIMPYDSIYNELSKDTLNAAKLTFTNYNEENNQKFSMSAPKDVLLIRKKDLKSFFEDNKLTDNMTSFTVSHNNVASNQYTFKNIARLVTTCINEKQAAKKKAKETAGSTWDEIKWESDWKTNEATKDWDKVLLIPIVVTYDYSNNQNPTMTSIQNDLQPGYAKLKGGTETDATGAVKTPLKIEVTYTRFNN